MNQWDRDWLDVELVKTVLTVLAVFLLIAVAGFVAPSH